MDELNGLTTEEKQELLAHLNGAQRPIDSVEDDSTDSVEDDSIESMPQEPTVQAVEQPDMQMSMQQPETPVAPKTQPARLNIAQLLQDRTNALEAARNAQIGEKLIQVGSTAGGINYKPDNSSADYFKQKADLAIQNVNDRPALDMVSSDSDISKTYRDYVQTRLKIPVSDKVSAETLIKLLPQLKSMGIGNGRGYRFEKIQDPDGKIRTYAIDPTDPTKKTEIGQSGFAIDYRTDPNTGGIIANSKSAVQRLGSIGNNQNIIQDQTKGLQANEVKAGHNKEMDVAQLYNGLSPNSKKAVDKVRDELLKDDIVKIGREAEQAANGALTLLKFGNARGADIARAVQNMLARATGEKGAMTENDVAPFGGQAALLSKAKQSITSALAGRFTDDNRQFLSAFAQTLKSAASRKVTEGARPHIIELQRTIGASLPQSMKLTNMDQLTKLDVDKSKVTVIRKSDGKAKLMDVKAAEKYKNDPNFEVK